MTIEEEDLEPELTVYGSWCSCFGSSGLEKCKETEKVEGVNNEQPEIFT